MSETRGERLLRSMAVAMTGSKGSDSLNRLAKLLVVGELRSKGFEDARNAELPELFKRTYVCGGHFNFLVRFSFLSDNLTFIWDFASGNVVGKSTGEGSYISSKGRHSKWVGDGAERNWVEDNIGGVVLVGLDSNDDLCFYFLTRGEFLELGQDRIIVRPGEGGNPLSWETNWKNLTFQPTFASVLSG